MDKVYYEEYFDLERNHWWFRARKEILNGLVKKFFHKTPSKILNVGAATGYTSEWLSQFGEVTSVEYEKDCCDFVKQKLNVEFINASITELPFPDHSFDLVCAFDVIEHVEDDVKAVSEMYRVCSPGGMVAVTVPAFQSLWSKHDEINHHKRRYTKKQLERLFQNIAGKKTYSGFFNVILFLPIFLTRFLSNIFPFIVRRKGSGSDFSYSGNTSTSGLLFSLMKSEGFWMTKGLSFPFGVSLVLFFRKES